MFLFIYAFITTSLPSVTAILSHCREVLIWPVSHTHAWCQIEYFEYHLSGGGIYKNSAAHRPSKPMNSSGLFHKNRWIITLDNPLLPPANLNYTTNLTCTLVSPSASLPVGLSPICFLHSAHCSPRLLDQNSGLSFGGHERVASSFVILVSLQKGNYYASCVCACNIISLTQKHIL